MEFCWRRDYYEFAVVKHATYQLNKDDGYSKFILSSPTSVGGFLLIPVTPEGRAST